MRIIIATVKSWNIEQSLQFKKKNPDYTVEIITEKSELVKEKIDVFNPDFIFFPHWSWFIPEDIYTRYKCIVFHMTDLPFGRGGSPLQNLIVRGINETKISAIQVVKDLDAGNIYLKKNLKLNGSADEIFRRASVVIFEEMIPKIIETNPKPVPQEGEVVTFKRRTEAQSEIDTRAGSIEDIYNHIRMLDGEGYPAAFIQYGRYRLEFTSAKFDGEEVTANVIIREEVDE